MMDIPLILACPGCTYERVNPTWIAFAAARIAVPVLLSLRKFDPVRIFAAFVGYEMLYFFAWRTLTWFGHPAVMGGIFFDILLAFLQFGVVGAVFFIGLSKLEYFNPKQNKIQGWRVILYVLAIAGIGMFQQYWTWL